jgi:hypothetical protein
MDDDLDAVQGRIDDIEINLDGHEAKVVALERLVADPDDVDMLEPFALAGRWRVRQALGLPEDAYDLTARIVRERDRARWAADNG